MVKRFKALDLFSGVGVFHAVIISVDFDIVSVEIDSDARDTYSSQNAFKT